MPMRARGRNFTAPYSEMRIRRSHKRLKPRANAMDATRVCNTQQIPF